MVVTTLLIPYTQRARAICIMAGIRENLDLSDVPSVLKGAPITLITAGILTLAFMGPQEEREQWVQGVSQSHLLLPMVLVL